MNMLSYEGEGSVDPGDANGWAASEVKLGKVVKKLNFSLDIVIALM